MDNTEMTNTEKKSQVLVMYGAEIDRIEKQLAEHYPQLNNLQNKLATYLTVFETDNSKHIKCGASADLPEAIQEILVTTYIRSYKVYFPDAIHWTTD